MLNKSLAPLMLTEKMATTIQNLKSALLKYSNYTSKSNTTGNRDLYTNMADDVWREEVFPFVKNEEITTWEKDILDKLNNPYNRFAISEKQAFCLARAFARINPELIK